MSVLGTFLLAQLLQGCMLSASTTSSTSHVCVYHTVKRHKQPYLPVVNPLPDTIPCAFLDSRHQRTVINDTVEHLSTSLSGLPHMRLRAVLRVRSLPCGAHLVVG